MTGVTSALLTKGKTYVPRGSTPPNGEKSDGLSFLGLVCLSANSPTAGRTHPGPFYLRQRVLEITLPLEGHERFARLIELFIRILMVELGLKMKSMGSTTLARVDLLKSAEPDNGYYIQSYALVADHEVDLAVDPPPDLVVEVDITHTDIQKNDLYASLGVPEFWRFNGREWRIFQLVEGRYEECDRSPTFPLVTKADFYGFLQTAIADEVTAEIDFRQWVRTQI